MKPIDQLTTKKSVLNRLFTLISPLTSSVFSDDNWRQVRAVEAALEGAGVRCDMQSTEYQGSDTNNMAERKQYVYKLTVGKFEFTFILHANFCGTVNNAWDKYDLTCTIY